MERRVAWLLACVAISAAGCESERGIGRSGLTSGAFVSDDFHTGTLNTQLWQVVDPQGDSTVSFTGVGTPDAHLLLSVPAGTTHDANSPNTALRVMQPAADEDLEIEVKFESEPTKRHQMQGLLVEQDSTNYLRLDVHYTGNELAIFSATYDNGTPSVRVDSTIASGATTYLRLTRSDNQWTAEYAYNGSNWVTAATFSHAMEVSSVGVFAGNAGPNPAYTAVVDYFFDAALPIVPEDAPRCDQGDEFVVAVASNGPGNVNRTPDQSTYGCGELITLTAQPDVGAQFTSWTGSVSGTTNPLTLAVLSDTSATANFELDETPPQVSDVAVTLRGSSSTISWETDEPAIGSVDFGETTSYELGSVDSSTLSTTHVVTLPGLIEGTLYHYRINAEDAAGNVATGPDRTFAAAVGDGPFVDVWYGDSQWFGALGNPQRWINVLGQVIDPDGLSALSFSLNGGPWRSLSVGPFRRLADPGDFNVEIDFTELLPGTNTIEILAVDGLGFETTKTVGVDYTAGNVWPLGYAIDWASTSNISEVAQIVDGRWSIIDGELRNDQQRYDRTVAIGDITWTDYEVTVPVTIHGFSPDGFGGVPSFPAVGVMLKWPGHSDWTGDQPTWGYHPAGGGAWYEFAADGSGALRLTDFQGGANRADPLGRVLTLGTTYVWKVRVETQEDGIPLYSVKVWAEGSPEPVDWEIVDTDPSDVPAGSLLLIAHYTDVTFGNIIIDPL